MLHELCNFGFLNQDRFSEDGLFVEDMGIEWREGEVYEYDNECREDFEGFLLQFTFQGIGHIETAGREFELREGDVFFLGMPDRSRYYLDGEKEEFWHYGYIHFRGCVGDIFLREVQRRKGKVFTINPNSAPIRMFLEECSALQKGKRYQQLESSEWMYGLLCALIREIDTPEASFTPLMDRAVQWLNRSYEKRVGIGDMCEELGVSKEHMSRQFHGSMGCTPVEYLTKLRMDHAIELLLNTTLSVKEIAELCGFDNGNYFTKVFRNYMKVTPSIYRSRKNPGQNKG